MKKSGFLKSQICDLPPFLQICSQSRGKSLILAALFPFARVELVQRAPRASLQRRVVREYTGSSLQPHEKAKIKIKRQQKCRRIFGDREALGKKPSDGAGLVLLGLC